MRLHLVSLFLATILAAHTSAATKLVLSMHLKTAISKHVPSTAKNPLAVTIKRDECTQLTNAWRRWDHYTKYHDRLKALKAANAAYERAVEHANDYEGDRDGDLDTARMVRDAIRMEMRLLRRGVDVGDKGDMHGGDGNPRVSMGSCEEGAFVVVKVA